ncbi:unnamed protein product [Vitrella brassicaformis CCMP3155]|uniref:Uncharacterized protein n=1 Tax=Vitrella brassicaformis (strain CCMP3155) TaxID=1169540 RepID=A0A0G4ERM2_VITBC|nr:unnamed protein product [Vitrella brassicaformis CCMP3155]|eukprot:CEL99938.1 unnamed protein product [Vitrella brassicaformis CCMP3155]
MQLHTENPEHPELCLLLVNRPSGSSVAFTGNDSDPPQPLELIFRHGRSKSFWLSLLSQRSAQIFVTPSSIRPPSVTP